MRVGAGLAFDRGGFAAAIPYDARVLSEFGRIARFTRHFPTDAPSVLAGPGDDCAITRPSPGRVLVSKVDQVVEGIHFGPAFRPEEIGHKALAVALSDLAAAGAVPRWFLVAIAHPPSLPPAFLDGMARGMSRLAAEAEIVLVGGNFSAARELSLTVTALGEALPDQVLRRSGARPGDWLLVSGTLGDAALGLRRLAKGRPARLDLASRAQLRPRPRLELGAILGRYAHAAIDISDGLLQDLGHLCTRSGLGATLRLADLPIRPQVRREGLELALAGGEDYEILCAAPPKRARALLAAAARRKIPLRPIGHLHEGEGIRLLDARDRELPLPAREGWEHFA